jgi:hypothetical protein
MAKNLREQVQTQVVQLITKGLEQGTISEERGRSIAKLILDKLPEDINDKELMLILPKLDDEFEELSEVVVPIMVEYEDRIRKAVEEKVLNLVRQKNFTQALETARKGIEYSKQLG